MISALWCRFWMWTLDYLPASWAPWVVGLALWRMPKKVK